ncbi:hypothetical protein KEM54_004697 [Ascosphaera aggregata]|nr:hypothetical protein KEM54_004697 [Ascosphaera aggregata]
MGHNHDECPDLFERTKFWVSLGVPKRTHFIGQAKELVNLDDYRAGLLSGAGREVGSSTLPHKFRTPFTAQEDKDIYDYVQDCKRKGKKILGNAIYKDFYQTHRQHTWQSWRDRYVKITKRLKKRSAKDNDASEEESPGGKTVRDSKQRSSNGEQWETPMHGDLAAIMPGSGQLRKHPLADNAQLPPSVRRNTKRVSTGLTPSVSETPFEQSPGPVDDNIVPPTRGTVPALTSQQTEELLSYTEEILLLDRQEEDEWFHDYAERTQHSPDVCRSHFYDTVLPEYHRRQNRIKLSWKAVASGNRDGGIEEKEHEKAGTRGRSSSVPSLYFDVMERDIPRRSSESSNEALAREVEGKHQAQTDDEESYRLLSQEPISSGDHINETQNEIIVPNSSNATAKSKEGTPQSQGDSYVDSESDSGPTGREPSLELGGFAPYDQPSQPAPASDTQDVLDEEEETAKIQSWLISKCEEYSIMNPAPFVDALLCTSISLEHADKVVGYLVKGKPIPKDIAGVWSASDDQDLLSGNQRKVAKLIDKHGPKLVELRKEYLHKKSQLNSRGQELIVGL